MNNINILKNLSENYNREHGLSLIYIAKVLFDESRKDYVDKISHIFDVEGIIDIKQLKGKGEKKTRALLLEVIFANLPEKRIVKRHHLRELVGLKNRTTFNKYFAKHINSVVPENYKGHTYTLYETFQILSIYQGGDIWGRMKIYGKGELARKFFNRNYETLDVMLGNSKTTKKYLNEDFLFPSQIKDFLNSRNKKNLQIFNLNTSEFKFDKLNELDVTIDCLEVCFFLCLINKLLTDSYK